jgi:hypothetical protein
MRSPGSFFPRSRRWDRRHSGEVADEVLRVAREIDASVIVDADCPVLAVKP